MHSFEAHKNIITSVAFEYDSMILASASEDSSIKLWDLKGLFINK